MWWGVRVLLEATHPAEDARSDDLFEDRIVLVEAGDEATAREKAHLKAESEAPEYLNQFGGQVSWKVVEVIGAQSLIEEGPPRDGSQVFWSFLHRREVEQLAEWQRPFDS